MTTIVILLLGLGAVLLISSLETDPATGQSVSVLNTISDIWNDRVNFSQGSSTVTTGGQDSSAPPSGSPLPGGQFPVITGLIPSAGFPGIGGGPPDFRQQYAAARVAGADHTWIAHHYHLGA